LIDAFGGGIEGFPGTVEPIEVWLVVGNSLLDGRETQDLKTHDEDEEGFVRIMDIDTHRVPLQAIHSLYRRDVPKKLRVLILHDKDEE